MKSFRKTVSALLALVMVFAFSACGEQTETPAKEEQKEKAEAVYPLSESESVHTIVLVSDTQKYAQKDEDTNIAMLKALTEDKEKYNIEYVIHSGDLVQSPENTSEWETARAAMNQLNGVIPYGVLAGNHDQDTGDDRFTSFGKYFGEASYEGCDYFGGSFENCRASFQLVTVGSEDFVVVYISDDPSKGCIAFANSVFEQYSDRIGILVTHKYLEENLELEEMGEYMLKNIIEKNSNVYLVLCGHESAVGYLETKLDDGRRIIQIMGNYQDAGNASMLYLQIDEAENTLTGISYSPVEDTYEGYKNLDTDQFKIDLPW